MTEAEAWMCQVESDFAAATRVYVPEESATYCQVIAKYQQVVEKSINCIDAVLRERGILVGRAKAEHYPERMINRLVRIPRSEYTEIADQLVSIFRRWNADIFDICSLAPKLPPKGESYRPNTEYPFQKSDGSWTAPTEESSFTKDNVLRFERVARQMRAKAEQIGVVSRL